MAHNLRSKCTIPAEASFFKPRTYNWLSRPLSVLVIYSVPK